MRIATAVLNEAERLAREYGRWLPGLDTPG